MSADLKIVTHYNYRFQAVLEIKIIDNFVNDYDY